VKLNLHFPICFHGKYRHTLTYTENFTFISLNNY